MSKKLKNNLSSPILYIILGALLIIFKAQMLNWAMTIAGIFFAVMGIVDLTKGRKSGALNLVIGILILVLGNTILDVVLVVLGILIAVKGLVDLLEILKNKMNCVALPNTNTLSAYVLEQQFDGYSQVIRQNIEHGVPYKSFLQPIKESVEFKKLLDSSEE